MAASLRWILQLHKDVPKASKFYSEGLGLTVNVCTLRWAELESGPLKLALMQSPSNHVVQKGYSSLLSFTVSDINNTVAKLLALGAELDGPIKYEIHGKRILSRIGIRPVRLFYPRAAAMRYCPTYSLHPDFIFASDDSNFYDHLLLDREFCRLTRPALRFQGLSELAD